MSATREFSGAAPFAPGCVGSILVSMLKRTVRCRSSHEREHVGEARDALAVHGPLLGKARRVLAAGPDPPDVVLLQLRVGEVDERRSRCLQELAAGIARVVGIEQRGRGSRRRRRPS